MGCCLNGKKAGVMLPTPQYPLFSACLQEYEIAEIKYYLDESKDWGLDLDSLRKSVTEARKWCQPTAIVVINPGNPTGQVMSEKELKEIVKFAYEENLVIISDEVYQEAVYAPDRKFHSMKKVMTNMGKPYSQLELFSFISASKGITCECGLRGGLMEMVNVDQFVRNKLYTLMATQICPNTLGQIALDVILNPPAKGDPSHEQYKQEVADILDNMRRKSELAKDTFNSLPGIHCNRIDSGYYSFPRVEMPEKAIEEAEARGLDPDTFYVLELLNETGICLSPGSSFGEAPGTVHFRLTFLVPDEELQQALALYKEFHLQFLQKYK